MIAFRNNTPQPLPTRSTFATRMTRSRMLIDVYVRIATRFLTRYQCDIVGLTTTKSIDKGKTGSTRRDENDYFFLHYMLRKSKANID